MGPELYMPFQRLDYFRYKESDKDLFIDAKIQVYLQPNEILVCRELNPVIPIDEFSIILHYDVKIPNPDPANSAPFKIETHIKIGSNVTYQGIVTDEASKINDLRNQIKKRLKDLNTDFFVVKSIVYETDGSESGQVANTISGDNNIMII